MSLKLGVIGCGRLGRAIFRKLTTARDAPMQLVAMCDRGDSQSILPLLRFDSLLGPHPYSLTHDNDIVRVAGHDIVLRQTPDAAATPWDELGVDVVVETTNAPRSHDELLGHIKAGAKQVIACVPPKEQYGELASMGINSKKLNKGAKVFWHGSVTGQALAPLVSVVQQHFGIDSLHYTSVHAYGSEQRLADVPGTSLRRSRAAAENIVPDVPSADAFLTSLWPGLQNKVSGMTLRVPTANGSLVDMVVSTQKPVSLQAVHQAVQEAAAGELKGILAFGDAPYVSTDVIGSTASCLYDSLASMVQGAHTVKLLGWYDNASGYASRVLELAQRIGGAA